MTLNKHAMMLLAAVLILSTAQLGLGKKGDSAPSNGQDVRAGTKISAQLESTVDAKNAKAGDEVTAKVTSNVKQDGKVVVHKGDRLVGHVSNVQAESKERAGSQLGVTFDHLVSGGSTTELHSVVSAVLSSSSEQNAGDNDAPLKGSGSSPLMTNGGGRAGAGGGMLGGATSTVGQTAGVAGSAAGNVGGAVGGATSSTVGGVARTGIATPTKMIHVDSAAQVENRTSLTSSLSTPKGDLRLDSGTRLQFRVAAEGSAQASH